MRELMAFGRFLSRVLGGHFDRIGLLMDSGVFGWGIGHIRRMMKVTPMMAELT